MYNIFNKVSDGVLFIKKWQSSGCANISNKYAKGDKNDKQLKVLSAFANLSDFSIWVI